MHLTSISNKKLIFLLGGIIVFFVELSNGLLCEHYADVSKGDDHACNETQIDENQICNITVECNSDFGQFHNYCFTSWQNISGVITIEKQACWTADQDCRGKSKCEHTGPEHETKLMFCCCEKDLCNAQFSANIIDEPLMTTGTTEDPELEPVDDSATIAATVVIVLIVAVVTVAVAIYCYRRKKKKLSDLDAASVGTPASGLTTTTAGTNLLQPATIAEVNLPQLIDMRARGRFGCVWKAQLQDRYVAVKSFHLQDKQSWQNEQEIFNTSLVNNHPNILKFIAAASRGMGVEIEYWLITEFHEHGSLTDYLKTRVISITDALCFIKSMATGLAFLHEDVLCKSKTDMDGYKPAIAHRDFKSKNVLVTNKKIAVIADFGLAIKFVPGESLGETHGQVGTRRYMAPEILEGAINFNRDAFLRIDMYAFALVIWEVLTRCFDAPGGASSTYLMPYEEELSLHPTIEEMQENVVEKKLRPRIMREWRQHAIIGMICETIEECWDHDVEARLSAGCVEERLRNLQKKIIAPPPDLPIQTNCLNCPPSDVEVQNQLNAQRNEMQFNEQTRLISNEQSPIEMGDPAYVSLPPESPHRIENAESIV